MFKTSFLGPLQTRHLQLLTTIFSTTKSYGQLKNTVCDASLVCGGPEGWIWQNCLILLTRFSFDNSTVNSGLAISFRFYRSVLIGKME